MSTAFSDSHNGIIREVERLARMLATAQVRRYAVTVGRGPNETKEGTQLRVTKAKDELRAYLERVIP